MTETNEIIIDEENKKIFFKDIWGVEDIPQDVEKKHSHFDGICTKALYCKREDRIYITYHGLAYLCDEPLIAEEGK